MAYSWKSHALLGAVHIDALGASAETDAQGAGAMGIGGGMHSMNASRAVLVDEAAATIAAVNERSI